MEILIIMRVAFMVCIFYLIDSFFLFVKVMCVFLTHFSWFKLYIHDFVSKSKLPTLVLTIQTSNRLQPNFIKLNTYYLII